jgi:hypothetical protein
MPKTFHALAVAVPLGLAGFCALPASADARPVKISTSLKAYGGNGAYLAIYITDASGKLQQTVRVAGSKAKYHRNLSAWYRQSGGRLDGSTGASVGSGQTLAVSLDIADALIDAGFQIRVDSAVEDMADAPNDALVDLTTANAGKPVSGKGFVQSLRFDM